ncbi:MAG: hypothetical protein Q9217_000115 [Psora testacea]
MADCNLLNPPLRQLLSSAIRQFILSYFQEDFIEPLHLSEASYGILSGYATGIVYALLALPTAYRADYIKAYMLGPFPRRSLTDEILPLYITALSGIVLSIFVLLMVFSRQVSDNSESKGINVLYGTMSIAYLTAEPWLGAINSLIALLLLPRYNTFGHSIWAATQVLICSLSPEIVGLAIRKVEVGSVRYLTDTRIALVLIIPIGYWLAGIGFLLVIPLVKRDLTGSSVSTKLSMQRRTAFIAFGITILAVVIALSVMSIVYKD